MKQENHQTEIIDEVERYNCLWKQDIVLSDYEDQFIQIASDEEKEQATMLHFGKALDIQPCDAQQVNEVLNYLDAPQLKMSTLQSPKNVIHYFIPNDFISSLTEMINKYLMAALLQDQKQQTQQTQQLYNKKKYKDTEIQFYLGLQILFGMYRFPQLDEYWNAEPWLRGGIEISMPIGRLKFVDMYLCSHDEETQRATISSQLKKFKQKIKALYNPDQELVVTQQIYKAYTTYYLFDCESSQILDLLVVVHGNEEEKLNKIIRMLLKYANQNHVMYFMFEIKLEKIIQLVDQGIYPVIYYKNLQHSLIQTLNDGEYSLDQLYLIKQGQEIYIFPQKRLISHKHYVTNHRSIQEEVSEHLLNIQQFRSQFYFSSQLNSPEGFQQLRIEFEEYFEVMIHNTFLLFQYPSYKSYRHELAQVLLGEKGQQIERERKEAKRKLTVSYKETPVNTVQLDFGLLNQYGEEFHTPFPQKQDDTFKYCLVCMKFEGLTKPYYRCNLCEKLLNQSKIFLCPFPCFELFHRNPSDFISCDMQALSSKGEGKYFKNESTIALVAGSQEEEVKTKRNKHKPPPRPFWSYNREIYKQANVNDDKNLNEILSTFKKAPPTGPSPNLLQSIIPAEQSAGQDTNGQGHKNDLKDIEDKLNYERDQRDRAFREMQENERQLHEQLIQQAYERQMQEKEQESKKSKKSQKEAEKRKQLEEQMKNVSPLEQFLVNMNKNTKQEDAE